ncbi:hypothetical protein HZS_6294 [Henneguya salminicola]|nr:hypothetical protein HZS_6294 [Henneguya salminicola]
MGSLRPIYRLIQITLYSNGDVCISILHNPGEDPYGYEHRLERWSPVISKLYREDPEEFKKQAKKYVDDSLIYEL